MGKIFNMDSPIMRFLARLWDVMVVNFLIILFLIPLFAVAYFAAEIASVSVILLPILLFIAALPFGPALTAAHYISLKMVRNEESYVVRGFFHSVKENFRQAVCLWAIYLVFFLVTFFDLYMIVQNGTSLFPEAMNIALMGVFIILWMNFLWAFPYLSHFKNTVLGTIRNAIIMAIAAFPRTLAMVFFSILPILLMFTDNAYVMPILFMLGLGGPIYLSAILYNEFFKKFEPAVKQEDPDATPQGLLGDVENPEFKETLEELRRDLDKISYDRKDESAEVTDESGIEVPAETEAQPGTEAPAETEAQPETEE